MNNYKFTLKTPKGKTITVNVKHHDIIPAIEEFKKVAYARYGIDYVLYDIEKIEVTKIQ